MNGGRPFEAAPREKLSDGSVYLFVLREMSTSTPICSARK